MCERVCTCMLVFKVDGGGGICVWTVVMLVLETRSHWLGQIRAAVCVDTAPTWHRFIPGQLFTDNLYEPLDLRAIFSIGVAQCVPWFYFWTEASFSLTSGQTEAWNLELKPVARFHASETRCWTWNWSLELSVEASCSFPCEWKQMLNLELKPVVWFHVSEIIWWTLSWTEACEPDVEPWIEACCSFPCEWNHLVDLESPHCLGVNWGIQFRDLY